MNTINKQKKIHQLDIDNVIDIISALSDILFIVDRNGIFLDYYSSDPSKFLIDEKRISVSSIYNIFQKDEADRHLQDIRSCIETGKIISIEYCITVNDSERHFEARMSRLNDEAVLSIVRDITERVLAQKALIESEKKFRDIAEMLPVGIFETDSNLMVIYGNKTIQEMYGYNDKDIAKGIMILDLLSKDDFTRAKENIVGRFNSTNSAPSKYTGVRKDGNTFPMSMHSSAVFKNGKPTGLRGIVIDLSKGTFNYSEKQKSETLEKAKKLKVLIMDDEFLIREVAGKMLSDAGMIVEKTSGGEITVEKFRKSKDNGEPFDIVILDLTIPGGIGGVDILSTLKKITPDVKAIASSGFSEDPVLERPQDFGFKCSIPKPYSKEELIRIVLKVFKD